MEIEIPFGAKDSELMGWEYTIPEDMEAIIKDGKVIVKKKESEDEKIRNDIMEAVENWLPYERVEEIRAYLEKWKINTEGDFVRGYDCGYECCLNSHGAEWFEKQKEQKSIISAEESLGISQEEYNKIVDECIYGEQKEQKPVEWSAEDESNLQSCIAKIEIDMQHWGKHGKTMVDGDIKLIDWLKSLPERLNLPPKQDWSEDDERMLNNTLSYFPIIRTMAEAKMILSNDNDVKVVDECCSWLKSLRPRPHWKPSEEQIEALNTLLCVGDFSYVSQHQQLQGLYNDLKKL